MYTNEVKLVVFLNYKKLTDELTKYESGDKNAWNMALAFIRLTH